MAVRLNTILQKVGRIVIAKKCDATIPVPLIVYESGAFLARCYQPYANKMAFIKISMI